MPFSLLTLTLMSRSEEFALVFVLFCAKALLNKKLPRIINRDVFFISAISFCSYGYAKICMSKNKFSCMHLSAAIYKVTNAVHEVAHAVLHFNIAVLSIAYAVLHFNIAMFLIAYAVLHFNIAMFFFNISELLFDISVFPFNVSVLSIVYCGASF